MLSVFSHLKKQFLSSAHALRCTRTLSTAGILLAIQMVLSSYGVIEVNDSLKISLAHLAPSWGSRYPQLPGQELRWRSELGAGSGRSSQRDGNR